MDRATSMAHRPHHILTKLWGGTADTPRTHLSEKSTTSNIPTLSRKPGCKDFKLQCWEGNTLLLLSMPTPVPKLLVRWNMS